jgi:hypothetical protein
MSAFLPLATTERTSLEVRFVPRADIDTIDRARVNGALAAVYSKFDQVL